MRAYHTALSGCSMLFAKPQDKIALMQSTVHLPATHVGGPHRTLDSGHSLLLTPVTRHTCSHDSSHTHMLSTLTSHNSQNS